MFKLRRFRAPSTPLHRSMAVVVEEVPFENLPEYLHAIPRGIRWLDNPLVSSIPVGDARISSSSAVLQAYQTDALVALDQPPSSTGGERTRSRGDPSRRRSRGNVDREEMPAGCTPQRIRRRPGYASSCKHLGGERAPFIRYLPWRRRLTRTSIDHPETRGEYSLGRNLSGSANSVHRSIRPGGHAWGEVAKGNAGLSRWRPRVRVPSPALLFGVSYFLLARAYTLCVRTQQ